MKSALWVQKLGSTPVCDADAELFFLHFLCPYLLESDTIFQEMVPTVCGVGEINLLHGTIHSAEMCTQMCGQTNLLC